MTLTLFLLAAAALAAALVAFRGLNAVARRLAEVDAQLERQRKTHARLREELATLHRQVGMLSEAQKRAVARAAESETTLKRLRAEFKAQSAPRSALSQRTLEGAIRQVRAGAAPGELVDHFGLSPMEAELLAKLHGQAH